jgi:hypothetical protein
VRPARSSWPAAITSASATIEFGSRSRTIKPTAEPGPSRTIGRAANPSGTPDAYSQLCDATVTNSKPVRWAKRSPTVSATGIMIAINVSVSFAKHVDPQGDRVVITFNGMFLPHQ